MRKILLAGVLASLAVTAAAQPSPPGLKGKDWDRQRIDIASGAVAEIEAQVTTKNHQSGNSSSVTLYIDGIKVDAVGSDKGEQTLSYTLRTSGQHTVQAVCDNRRADANSCTLNITGASVKRID